MWLKAIETNSDEIRVFLAVTMLQGLVAKPTYWFYWFKKPIIDTLFWGAMHDFEKVGAIKEIFAFHK